MKNREREPLQATAERLAAVIETVIDGIITIDERGVIETINPAAATLFGIVPEDVIGQNVSVLMPSPYRKEHDGYMERYHRTGEARIIGIGREVEGLRSDGSTFPLRLAVSEMRIGDRRMYTGIVHDLTDIKEAERKIIELNKKLEEKVSDRTERLANAVNRLLATNRRLEEEVRERQEAEEQLRQSEIELQQSLAKEKQLNALKSRFVSMASHEFRTPLSTILSSAELVEMYHQGEQQPKRLRHLNRIKSAVNNLNDVLNDFLSLSRLEEGQLKPLMEPFNLADFCNGLHEEVAPLLREGQQLSLITEGIDREVVLDKKFLRNSMINLMSNATKYSDEGKTVHCRAVVENDQQLRIEIRDEGIGIPEEDQQHLFTRFFRAHNVENVKGTGLGLHIVKRYVELMGGSIHFSSKLGDGSTFTILLPLDNEPALAE